MSDDKAGADRPALESPNMHRPNAGFSLIEIIVAVSVLSILAAVMVPVVSGVIDDARVTNAETDLSTIKTAYNQFFNDTGHWPGNGNGTWNQNDMTDTLGSNNYVLFTNTGNVLGWNGPYLENWSMGSNGNPAFTNATNDQGILDPWGYRYRISGFAPGSVPEAPFGALVAYSRGPNNTLDTGNADLALGNAQGDDIVKVITVKP